MKIIRFVDVCPTYYDPEHFFKAHKNSTTVEIVADVTRKQIINPHTFSKAMQLLGIECIDLLLNEQFLMKWCKENNIPYENYERTIEKMTDHYKPDFIYVERLWWYFRPEFIQHLKSAYSFLRGIVTWVGQFLPEEQRDRFKEFDIIFCIDSFLIKDLSAYNKNVFLTRPGLDTLRKHPIHFKKKHLFTFLGSSGHGMSLDHSRRFEILKYLLSKTPIKIWANEHLAMKKKKFHSKDYFAKIFNKNKKTIKFLRKIHRDKNVKSVLERFLNGESSDSVLNDERLEIPLKYLSRKQVYPPLQGEEYARVISQSKISFNCHVDQENYAGNFRVFEVAGFGSCLLTDRAYLMQDILEPEKEVINYNTPEEAVDKFEYLKKHPQIIEDVSKRAQERMLKEHTIYHRCRRILNILNEF